MNCKKYGIEVTGCSYMAGDGKNPVCDVCLEKCLQEATFEKTTVKIHSTIAKIKPTMVKIMPVFEVGGDLVWKKKN